MRLLTSLLSLHTNTISLPYLVTMLVVLAVVVVVVVVTRVLMMVVHLVMGEVIPHSTVRDAPKRS